MYSKIEKTRRTVESHHEDETTPIFASFFEVDLSLVWKLLFEFYKAEACVV